MHAPAHAYNGPEMLLRHGLAFAVHPTFVVIKKEWVMFESKA